MATIADRAHCCSFYLFVEVVAKSEIDIFQTWQQLKKLTDSIEWNEDEAALIIVTSKWFGGPENKTVHDESVGKTIIMARNYGRLSRTQQNIVILSDVTHGGVLENS